MRLGGSSLLFAFSVIFLRLPCSNRNKYFVLECFEVLLCTLDNCVYLCYVFLVSISWAQHEHYSTVYHYTNTRIYVILTMTGETGSDLPIMYSMVVMILVFVFFMDHNTFSEDKIEQTIAY